MKFTTIIEVEEALGRLVSIATQPGRGVTTARTFTIAELVGNPQDRLRVVHVAGTSGKTSTSYYMARLLHAGGALTGLTVSPHIKSITERVQINGQPLSDEDFCEYMSEFLPLATADQENLPSYFEVMMVFALWVFDKRGVDYAVIETGLGGLHDSSNICRRTDKVCVITDIGIDHTHVLGNTVEEIAAQKAGIIAPGNNVIMHHQNDSVMGVINEYVGRQDAHLNVVSPQAYRSYQDRNFALARAVYNEVADRDGLPVIDDENLEKIRRLTVPGRFETVTRRGVNVLRDGAHNEQKMQALVGTLRATYPGQKWAIILAMKQSKDYEAVIRLLAPITSRAIATRFELSQDVPIRSVDPDLLIKEFGKYGVECDEYPTVAKAVDAFINQNEQHILVTGSLYSLSQV
jgi:dihydrofolate synthase/folylpolyglutamate synthase